jgi:hypothetical protein
MTTSRVPGDVLLMGSLHFRTEEDALRAAAAGLGSDVNAIPDGEPGDRNTWTTYLGIATYSRHRDLVETRTSSKWEPQPEDEGRPGSGPEYNWTFQIKPGVDALDFDTLHYAEAALKSYAIFTRLRDEGLIAPGVRFQVSLPGTSSGVNQMFDDFEQWPVVHAAYARAIGSDIEKMLETIPADDLAIQFDLAWEINDLSIGDERYFSFWPQRSYAEKFRAHTDLIVALTKQVPEAVVLGFHFCYGTWGGWPMTDMENLQLCVDVANDTVPRSARRIDYVQMPVTLDPDQAFFAALRDLNIGGTKVFLGLVHHEDGIEGSRRRIALARQSLPDFGISSVCGYGREDPANMRGIFELTQASARALHEPA